MDDYLENPSIYKTISERNGITKVLDEENLVRGYAPRLYSGGLSFFKTKSMGVSLVGIDPLLEPKVTTIKERQLKGQFFSESENGYEAIIGEAIAEVLKVGIGDKLVIITQAAYGSIANDLFVVKGIMPKVDGHTIYVPIKILQEYLALEGRVHEYAILGEHQGKAKRMAKRLQQKIDNPKFDIGPWQVVEKEFYEAMMADLKGNYFSMFIIMVIVSLGVLNSILMNVLDRTREFGVIKAMGTRPFIIFKLIMVEMFLLSFISVFIGIIIASFVNYYWVAIGYQHPSPITYGGITISYMKGMYSVKSFLEPGLVVIISTVVVSLFPAIKAAKTIPVKALRSV
jgi:ABC-type lipoprotein release transport system permease subunit